MNKEKLDRFIDKFKEDILYVKEFRDEITIGIKKEKVKDIMKFLRFEEVFLYDMLTDLCAADFIGEDPRFEVIYHLHSMKYGERLRVKVRVNEEEELETVSDIWNGANWLEREAFDMFGIRFKGHPELKRILLSDDFLGHPLRKDFPTEGYDFDKPFEVRLEEEIE